MSEHPAMIDKDGNLNCQGIRIVDADGKERAKIVLHRRSDVARDGASIDVVRAGGEDRQAGWWPTVQLFTSGDGAQFFGDDELMGSSGGTDAATIELWVAKLEEEIKRLRAILKTVGTDVEPTFEGSPG